MRILHRRALRILHICLRTPYFSHAIVHTSTLRCAPSTSAAVAHRLCRGAYTIARITRRYARAPYALYRRAPHTRHATIERASLFLRRSRAAPIGIAA